jgi:Mrp family chromosome partitioning ATPase
MQFENVARRPKLVGLTSCSTGSGVTTLATGLAAAMSESGQGKVLLVDLNRDNGSLHSFSRGQPACALTEALENGAGAPAAVQGNLVLASTTPHPLLSRTLLEAIPKLKASDYDYVIFDLPPVSQTSITLRLASYMDEVMVVAEAQKTHKGLLQKAYTLLTQSQANVRTILNKQRSYVPRFLQQEL